MNDFALAFLMIAKIKKDLRETFEPINSVDTSKKNK